MREHLSAASARLLSCCMSPSCGATHQEEKPNCLRIIYQRDFLEQRFLFPALLLKEIANVLPADQSALHRTFNLCSVWGNSRSPLHTTASSWTRLAAVVSSSMPRWQHSSPVPHLGLTVVHVNVGVDQEFFLHHCVRCRHPGWSTHTSIHFIQESKRCQSRPPTSTWRGFRRSISRTEGSCPHPPFATNLQSWRSWR